MDYVESSTKGAFYQELVAKDVRDDLWAYAYVWRWLMLTKRSGWDAEKIAADCAVSIGFALRVMDDVRL